MGVADRRERRLLILLAFVSFVVMATEVVPVGVAIPMMAFGFLVGRSSTSIATPPAISTPATRPAQPLPPTGKH